MFFKFIPLILPLLIFIFFRYLNKNNKQKHNLEKVIRCEACNVFVHESLVIKRFKKNYCSEKCSNP